MTESTVVFLPSAEGVEDPLTEVPLCVNVAETITPSEREGGEARNW